MERYYTVDEANAALDTIRPWLIELREIRDRLETVQTQLDGIGERARTNGRAGELDRLAEELVRLAERAKQLVDDLTARGIELKDPRRGLIDFRSYREGRVVYLCWHLGEGDIAYWHELDAGYRGRQPL